MIKRTMGVGAVFFIILGCIYSAPQQATPKQNTTVYEVKYRHNSPERFRSVRKETEEPTYEPEYEVREFTYDDAQMLMRIAQAEAGNQGQQGMELVMIVVLNRVASPDFPDTIHDVIFQPHQFQPVSDGRYYTVELSPEVHMALAEIETGKPIDEKIIAFENTSNNSLERYFTYAYTIGDHNFYTKKGEKEYE